jgi:hypothetical protein
MRTDGRTKKNLTLAFHFSLSNPNHWLCTTCRHSKLERKRHCRLTGLDTASGDVPIWARRDLYTTECPKPLIDPQSLSWIDAYVLQKRFGHTSGAPITANEADAFLILDCLTSQEVISKRHERNLTEHT